MVNNTNYILISVWILNLIFILNFLRSDKLKPSSKPFVVIVLILMPVIGAIGIWLYHPAYNKKKDIRTTHGNDAKSDNSYINQGFGSDD